jgi:fatty acid CoA ligase FadD36
MTVAGRSLDLEGLAGAAGAVARRISGLPVVGVEAGPGLETVVAVVGSLMAAVPVVPMPPDAGPMEREHILKDSGAEVVLGRDFAVDVAERADPPTLPSDDPGRLTMIVYTSGTTGMPKGVMLSAGAIARDLDLLAEAWEWSPDDVLVHGLPLYHVHGLVLGVLGALRVGSPLVHTGRPTPEAYATAAAGGGSLFFGVPTVWSRIARDSSAAQALRSARLLVSGSAGLPVPVFEALRDLAGQGPVERYGMTETLITISGRASAERRPGWVGWPLPGVETQLEEDGELLVRTPTVMSGYLGRPDATAEVLSETGWVRTGDAAEIDAGGWHRILGRLSTDMIKCGGFRIGAGEIESALLAHPAVREAAVVGIADDDLGEMPVAFVVAEGASPQQISDFVAQTLSVHKRPRRVELVEALPRNAMGKVQKDRLRAANEVAGRHGIL